MPEKIVIPIADSGNQGGIHMGLSEGWASWLNNVANVALIVALVIGVVSTVLVVWTSGVKEKYLKKSLAETTQRANEANVQLEKERITRLELEKSLAPRRLDVRTYSDKTTNLDGLKQIAGTRFIIESIPDFEARKAAGSILAMLKYCGFTVVRTGITENFTWDGVTVEQYLSPGSGNTASAMQREMLSGEREEVFREVMQDNGWTVNGGFAKRGELQPDELRVIVGYKPAPYFSEAPEWAKKMEEQAREMMDRVRRTPKVPTNKPVVTILGLDAPFPEEPK